jgi:Putative adhesin
MKRTVTLSIVAAALAALAAFANGAGPTLAAQPQQQSEFRWHEPLAAGRVIEIKGINGNVEATPAAGGEVEVVAVKRARRGNPDDVRIEVVRHGDGVTICAVYPTSEGREPNTCSAGPNDRSHVQNNDTSVNFTVRVPAGVRFTGKTVNGKVDANGLTADVEARTVNGGINVSTTGLARATTVNGSITVEMGRADWSDELAFKTVNGGIDLSLPASLSAQVQVKTLNGDISTDFPMTVTGTVSKRRLNGTVGAGGRDLVIETVNGSVQLRRAS